MSDASSPPARPDVPNAGWSGLMTRVVDQDAVALRAAIAWALHLAGSQHDTPIAALLSCALHITDTRGA